MAANAEVPAVRQFARKERHPAIGAFISIAKHPIGAVFGGIILLIVVLAITAPWITPYDPVTTSLETFEPPTLDHPFGTDDIGRDQLTRVIYGSRISLYVGLISVGVGITSGATLGLVSGFVGGKFDLILQRFVDGMQSIPGLVLAMALVSVLGTSTTNAMLAIAVVVIPSSSRVIRGAVLAVKQNVFIEAARTLGASPTRVMLRHLLPNVVAPILILVSASLGGAILVEAGLSFLGLGTQPPNPSWGLMLATSGRRYMEIAPWLAIFPGLAISITVLSFNMLGDTVRDILDPRLRGSR
jgi:ABC-type dipeptide/oligopeptide/nickel transport system permease subunit